MLSNESYEDSLRQAREYLRLAKEHDPSNLGMQPFCCASRSYKFALDHAKEYVVRDLINAGILDTMALSESEQAGKGYFTAFVPYACEKGDIDLLIKIIASGTNIDLPDVDGDTPLMIAVAHDEAKCVEYLLSVGANPEHKNKWGDNSYDLAFRFRAEKARRVLHEWKGNGLTFKAHHNTEEGNQSLSLTDNLNSVRRDLLSLLERRAQLISGRNRSEALSFVGSMKDETRAVFKNNDSVDDKTLPQRHTETKSFSFSTRVIAYMVVGGWCGFCVLPIVALIIGSLIAGYSPNLGDLPDYFPTFCIPGVVIGGILGGGLAFLEKGI